MHFYLRTSTIGAKATRNKFTDFFFFSERTQYLSAKCYSLGYTSLEKFENAEFVL